MIETWFLGGSYDHHRWLPLQYATPSRQNPSRHATADVVTVNTSVRAGTVSVFFPSEAVKVETALLSSLAVLVETPANEETPARGMSAPGFRRNMRAGLLKASMA